MGNEASFNPYDLNLIDQYRMQEDFNGGYSYLNSFVSVNWLTWNHNSEYPPEVCWHLYRTFLGYLAELKESGSVRDLTLSDYGLWHRENRGYAPPEVYLAKEMLYGSGKHYVWYLDGEKRCLLDPTQGGAIGDLRSYTGQTPVSTGPDSADLENGSYPYLIQSQHRTGNAHHHEDGARTTLFLEHRGQRIDLAGRRTKVAAIERGPLETRIRLTPAAFAFPSGLSGEIVTCWTFIHGSSRFQVERTLTSLNRAGESVRLIEHFKGAPGRTEYPEDLHGIVLEAVDAAGQSLIRMPFDYSGVPRVEPDAAGVRAEVPQANTRVDLSSSTGTPSGGLLKAGNLFSPYFTLQLHYDLTGPGSVVTQIELHPLSRS